MDKGFFERPILNSPYVYPDRHWELDDDGQPTNQILPEAPGFPPNAVAEAAEAMVRAAGQSEMIRSFGRTGWLPLPTRTC